MKALYKKITSSFKYPNAKPTASKYRLIYSLIAVILSGCATGPTASVDDKIEAEAQSDLIAYPGYTGKYPGFTLEIDDNFDDYDTEVWTKAHNHTFTEPQCIFEERGVQYNEGIMALTIDRADNEKGFYCGELRTKETYPYGRIEARIKTPPTEVASGFISSLFTYVIRPQEADSDEPYWREIDVEMEGNANPNDPKRDKKFQANVIFGDGVWQWYETRQWGAYEDKIVVGPTEEWKVYAIAWTPDYIRWLVDGELVKELVPEDFKAGATGKDHIYDANIPEYEMRLLMNFWIPNDLIENYFGGNKYRNQYPMKAEYDWFRYYRYAP